MIRKCFAICKNVCCQLQYFKRPDVPPVGDRTPPRGPRLPMHALPALSAVSSSTQRSTCNARNATYARSGQWHGWNLSHGMTCIKFEACFGPSIACFSLAYNAVRPRTSMYADVRCRKACSRCVWWRILRARTWKYDDVRLPMPTCGNVQRRTSMQDAADAKIICYLTIIYCNMSHKSSSLYGMLHPSIYDVDAVCVNAAMYIMLDYNVATRRMWRYSVRGLTCLRLETGL